MKNAQRKIKAVIATLGVCLVMCFVALIGMSFAWFVQSEDFTSSISVGTIELKVNGGREESAILSFENAEPGGVYFGYFSITNSGDVAFSCSLSVEIEDDVNGLADMLSVYIVSLESNDAVVSDGNLTADTYVGTLSCLAQNGYSFDGDIVKGNTKYYAAAIEFDSSATNGYMESSVTFRMTITATQAETKS